MAGIVRLFRLVLVGSLALECCGCSSADRMRRESPEDARARYKEVIREAKLEMARKEEEAKFWAPRQDQIRNRQTVLEVDQKTATMINGLMIELQAAKFSRLQVEFDDKTGLVTFTSAEQQHTFFLPDMGNGEGNANLPEVTYAKGKVDASGKEFYTHVEKLSGPPLAMFTLTMKDHAPLMLAEATDDSSRTSWTDSVSFIMDSTFDVAYLWKRLDKIAKALEISTFRGGLLIDLFYLQSVGRQQE